MKRLRFTVRRPLAGLGLAVALLAGVPACSDEIRLDIEAVRARAEQGDAEAQALLASAYYFGNGVEQDYAQAVRWSELAARQGNAVGQGVLGAAHYFGNGVEQDYAQAVRWARLAAGQGDARAQGILGAAYFLGNGVGQDYVSAHLWLNLAAAAGDESAGALRDQVVARMTPEQIVEAEAQARDRGQ